MVEAGLNARSSFQRASGGPPSSGTASRPKSSRPTPAWRNMAITDEGAPAACSSTAGRLAGDPGARDSPAAPGGGNRPATSASTTTATKSRSRRAALIPLNIRGSIPRYTGSRYPGGFARPRACRFLTPEPDAMRSEVSHAAIPAQPRLATAGAPAAPAGDIGGAAGHVAPPTVIGAGEIEIDRGLIQRFGGRAPRYTSYPTADR